MILIISFIILLALAIANYFLTKNIMNPAVVQPSLWAYQLIGLIVYRDLFLQPSVDALFIVIFCAFMFSVGVHLSAFKQAVIVASEGFDTRREFVLYLILTLVITICLYGQYNIFVNFAEGLDISQALIISRVLISAEDVDIYGLYKYGTTISYGTLLVLQIQILQGRANLFHKYLFVYIFVVSILLAFLTTGRGPIVHIFMLLGIVYILGGVDTKIHKRLGLAVSGVVFVTFFVFWILGNAMGKVGSSLSDAVQGIISYQFGAIPALTYYLSDNPVKFFGNDFGYNTFRFFFGLLASIGLSDPPPNLVQEFVSIPHLTNIYTSYHFYLKDFGWVGLVVFPLFLGLFHGHLFQWAMTDRKNQFALYVLAISYIPLFQSTGGETYFTHLSTWIQLLMVGMLLTGICRKKSCL